MLKSATRLNAVPNPMDPRAAPGNPSYNNALFRSLEMVKYGLIWVLFMGVRLGSD